MAYLDENLALGYPLAAGLGLLVGSFLNVVILRLPRRMESSSCHLFVLCVHLKFISHFGADVWG